MKPIEMTSEERELKLQESHTVFVYGSLRKTLSNHIFVENATDLGKFKLSGFGMYPIGDISPMPNGKINCAYPYCVESEDASDEIVVECYEVDGVELAYLDRLEGYPDLYNRKQVSTSTEGGDTVEGWVYYMDSAYKGINKIPNGDWYQFLVDYNLV